ncbi:MAG: 30S ribosomal protein S12 methylthiotransferase RimO [Bacillota bacterium]
MKTVALVSLGCPKNRIDSEYVLGALGEAGFAITDDPATADVTVVNTCGFIEAAKEESIRTILDLAELKKTDPTKRLVVIGCLAQRYAGELRREIPEIDAVAGTEADDVIVDLLSRVSAGERPELVGPPEGRPTYGPTRPRLLTTSPGTAYLKVAEGCDHRCAFCAIPSIRGPFRSRPRPAIIEEARQLVKMGVRELILVAQDATAYGRDLGPDEDLGRLLGELDAVPGVTWIRPLYLHPGRVDAALVEAIARSRHLCRYFDLPMQHASDRVLQAMGRGETSAGLWRLIGLIRERIPGAFLRASFIIGYPGETEADFEELLAFLKWARLDHAGFFAYSPEEGTRAADLPDQVPEEVKAERLRRVARRQRAVAREANRARVGGMIDVLIERRRRGAHPLVGRGEKDAPEIDGTVFLRPAAGASTESWPQAGEMVRARVISSSTFDLYGEVVGPA